MAADLSESACKIHARFLSRKFIIRICKIKAENIDIK